MKNDGHIRTVYKDCPIFGVISEQAARIAIVSDRQGIYSAVHTRLMMERRPLDDQVMREAVRYRVGAGHRFKAICRLPRFTSEMSMPKSQLVRSEQTGLYRAVRCRT